MNRLKRRSGSPRRLYRSSTPKHSVFSRLLSLRLSSQRKSAGEPTTPAKNLRKMKYGFEAASQEEGTLSGKKRLSSAKKSLKTSESDSGEYEIEGGSSSEISSEEEDRAKPTPKWKVKAQRKSNAHNGCGGRKGRKVGDLRDDEVSKRISLPVSANREEGSAIVQGSLEH